MSSSRVLSWICLPLCAAACSSYTARPREQPPTEVAQVPPEAAQICVYRPHRVAVLVPAVVHDNGTLVGMTQGRSYFCYLAQPGHHTIVSRYGDDIDARLGTDESTQATVVVTPGERYYLHHDVSRVFRLAVRWEGDPGRAEQAMADCTHVELDRVPDEASPLAPGAVAPARPVT